MGGHSGGRKRIPTALHVLQGGRKKTHRALPQNEPHPPAIIPKCPKHLDPEARKEWRRASKILETLGLLTGLDMAVFAGYCHHWSVWIQTCEKVRENGGWIIKASTGTPIQNPYLPVANKAYEEWMKAAVEIGLTPSSRSRVKIPEKPKKDAAEDFLNEGAGGK
jgi:P27 family predicted phage terminase small subunit